MQVNQNENVLTDLIWEVWVSQNSPPGRPIISGCGNLTENLDNHLKPFMICMPSYVHNTIPFLQIIQDMIKG